MDVRAFTVGPFQENTFILRRDGSNKALVVDPGDEPDLLLGAIEQLDATVEAILVTHTDIDHVGAVAPLAMTPSSGNAYVTWPSVWPGVNTTSMSMPASCRRSPPSTVSSAS